MSPSPASARPAVSEAQVMLLADLGDCAGRGTFSQTCDDEDRAIAEELEALGLAEWRVNKWGSSFWSITAAGRIVLASARSTDGGRP